jgi:biotin carboxyl carrier protein
MEERRTGRGAALAVQYEIEVNGHIRKVAVARDDSGRYIVSTGGRAWTVDASRVNGQLLSLLLEGDAAGPVASRELSVAVDPATGQTVVGIAALPVPVVLNRGRSWRRRDDAASPGGGPQRIVAPMPGKVVRIAAPAGTAVGRRQPVIVIEAMKMENELRASQPGTVVEVLVAEGQSVEAGTLLAVVSPA